MGGGGPGRRQDGVHLGCSKIEKKRAGMNQAKLYAIQCSELAKMKGNLQHRSLSNTTDGAVQPRTAISSWPGLHQDPRPLVRLATVL